MEKSGFIAYLPLVAKGVDDKDPSTYKHFLILNRQRLVLRYFAPRPAQTVVTTPLWLSCLNSGSDAAPSQDFLFLMQKNSEFIMEETFKTKGTCATTIQFTRDGDFIRNIRFTGGCNGNLKAIAKLCEGMKAEDIAAKLLGNTCGGKPTSCADQLARAVLRKEA